MSRCGPGTIAMRFDVANPRAVAWAEQRAARLVTNVTAEMRQTIRTLVAEGFTNGVPPRQTAQILRASIGLTERDAGAVMKRQLTLMAEGRSPAAAAKAAEKYAEKLTRRRALTIARTETMAASNHGQVELWQQASDAGLLTGTEKKVWITADPCPICIEFEGMEVGLNQEFPLGDPPAHPNCRCTIGMVP